MTLIRFYIHYFDLSLLAYLISTLGRIISGGEDCRYRVWDAFGRQLFSAAPQDYPITSLSWSPDGQYFAVGMFVEYLLPFSCTIAN